MSKTCGKLYKTDNIQVNLMTNFYEDCASRYQIEIIKLCPFCVTEEGMIIYISRGLLSSLTEAKDVLDTIAYYNGRMDNRIIINTYAVIDSKLNTLCKLFSFIARVLFHYIVLGLISHLGVISDQW